MKYLLFIHLFIVTQITAQPNARSNHSNVIILANDTAIFDHTNGNDILMAEHFNNFLLFVDPTGRNFNFPVT